MIYNPIQNLLTKRSNEDAQFVLSPQNSFKTLVNQYCFVPTQKHSPAGIQSRLTVRRAPPVGLSARNGPISRSFVRLSSMPRPAQLFEDTSDALFSNINLEKKNRIKIFTKESLLSSRLVCKKCKSKLRKNPEKKHRNRPEKVEPAGKTEASRSAESSSVFKNLEDVHNLAVEKPIAGASAAGWASLSPLRRGLKLRRLRKLSLLLVKFLMGERVRRGELAELSELETRIFLLFVNKKKSRNKQISRLDEDSLGQLGSDWIRKRFEENLRFVVNKAFKFLTKSFNDRLFYRLEQSMQPRYRETSWNSRFDYAFYGFYFQKVSSCIKKPLEIFFHPKSRRNVVRNAELVPKTISQYYLNLVCTSDVFKRDLKTYLDHRILAEAERNIVSKVESMCKKWENRAAAHGPENLIQEIRDQYQRNPKCKVPWGVQEVALARSTLNGIFSISKS